MKQYPSQHPAPHVGIADLIHRAGRFAIAALFAAGAVQKLLDPVATETLLAAAGLPRALVWPAFLLNALGAVALCAGFWLVPVAASLAAYCAITSFFHLIPDDPWQMSILVKNWAIAGGLLILCAEQMRKDHRA